MAGSAFTRDEVVLCAYAARFSGDDFGGVEAIHSLTGRSPSSIKMKVRNFASMLDEEGIPRENAVSPLSGKPKGEQGRRTNWEIVSELLRLSKDEHFAECLRILDRPASLPGELVTGEQFVEGAARKVLVNRYERDPRARRACIKHYGTVCCVCGFDFGDRYGELGKGFIEVHHIVPLSEIREDYVVDPIEDLIPVCPNCHAMIHRPKPDLSVDELRQLVKLNR